MNNLSLNYFVPIQQTQIPIQTLGFPYLIFSTPYFSQSIFQEEYKENQLVFPYLAVEQSNKLCSQQNIANDQILKTTHCIRKLKQNEKKQKNEIQLTQDDKGRCYGIKKYLSRQKYKQNPKRNVITNIGNQLLAFFSNRSRSEEVIKKIQKNITQQGLSSFYRFMSELRQTTDYYLNINKMKDIWYPQFQISQQFFKNRSLFRMVSYYYLNNMIHLFVLNSAKIKKSSKIFHIKAIRSLIKELTIKMEI